MKTREVVRDVFGCRHGIASELIRYAENCLSVSLIILIRRFHADFYK